MCDYKIWMDDEGVIRCALFGFHDRNDAEALTKEIIRTSKKKGVVKILMDLKEIEGTSSIARRIHIDAIKSKPEIFGKVALLGKSSISKVTANFIITGAGRVGEVRYFVSLKEALNWLKSYGK